MRRMFRMTWKDRVAKALCWAVPLVVLGLVGWGLVEWLGYVWGAVAFVCGIGGLAYLMKKVGDAFQN